MGDFRQNGGKRFGGGHGGGFNRRDGGRPNFSGQKWGGRDRGPVTMHQAICDQCGKPCEVPFRPTEGKPVYCNVCFGIKKEAGNNRGGDRFPRKDFNAGRGSNDESKRQFDILNTKLDRIIKALTPEVPAKAEKKEVIVKKKEKTKKSKKV